jgi:pyruvate/2-oxoglutarate dehydrogenase complex dihydrolipoamide dehydrogenase (E3) component
VIDQLVRNRVVTVQGTAQFLDEHHVEIKPDGSGPHSRTGETIIR